jgi:hypothetical protein
MIKSQAMFVQYGKRANFAAKLSSSGFGVIFLKIVFI